MCRAKRGPQWRRPKIRRAIVFNNVLNIYIYIYIYIYKFKTTKTTIFQSIKSYIFLKGLTHDFERKIQIFLYLFLVKIRRRIVLDDAVDKKWLFRLQTRQLFYVWKIPFLQRRKPTVLVREFEFFFVCSSWKYHKK